MAKVEKVLAQVKKLEQQVETINCTIAENIKKKKVLILKIKTLKMELELQGIKISANEISRRGGMRGGRKGGLSRGKRH
uniref:Uncharacterized protein n=1 Tax=Amphimedon queenslandica TaxID=400682 RepID=A0A1X7TPK1_AMPQE